MIKTQCTLPDWISRQVTTRDIIVDADFDYAEDFWFQLTFSCPLIFESYAVVLHPFWVNWQAKKLTEAGIKLSEEDVDEGDFEPLTWKSYFQLYQQEFDLDTAYWTRETIAQNNDQPA